MEAIETALIAEISKLLKEGVTKKEVERVKKLMMAEAIYARDSLSAGARVLGAALASGKTIEDVESWPHRIAAVTVDQVNAAAHTVLENQPTVTSLLEGEKRS